MASFSPKNDPNGLSIVTASVKVSRPYDKKLAPPSVRNPSPSIPNHPKGLNDEGVKNCGLNAVLEDAGGALGLYLSLGEDFECAYMVNVRFFSA